MRRTLIAAVVCGGSCVVAAGCGRIGFGELSNDAPACAYAARRAIEITTGAAGVPAGYSIGVGFDHSTLVANGDSSPSGDDVRVVRFDGRSWVDLDRVLDPGSTWGSSSTTVWFRTEAELPPSSTIHGEYELRFRAEGAPPADLTKVFPFADLFDRSDAPDLALGWRVVDASSGSVGNIDLANGALVFVDVSQNDNRPIADHVFPPMTRLAWRIGFAWQRTGVEARYRVHMQLGDSAVMEPTPSTTIFSNAGAGPSLVWGSPDQGVAVDESLAVDLGSALGDLGVVSGPTDLEILADVAADTYDVLVDGTIRMTSVPFASARSRLDQLRLMTWDVGHDRFALRQFDYVIVRSLLMAPPTVTLGPPICDEP